MSILNNGTYTSSVISEVTSSNHPSAQPGTKHKQLIELTVSQNEEREDLNIQNSMRVDMERANAEVQSSAQFPTILQSFVMPDSPPRQTQTQIVLTPSRPLDSSSVANQFTPPTHMFSNTLNTHAERVFSPYGVAIPRSRASPFIPFCQNNLSPLCNVEGNFASNASRRLFSPV
jgi:hypothetical protein